MFYNAIKFNQLINGWNVSGATTFVNIFRNETSATMAFNQPLNHWDTRSAVNMTTFFWYTTNYSQDLSSWNVDKERFQCWHQADRSSDAQVEAVVWAGSCGTIVGPQLPAPASLDRRLSV